MPPVTLRPYHIACRKGHKNSIHWSGYCVTCRKEGAKEIAFYLYEDDGQRQTCLPEHNLPPMNVCGECGGWAKDGDYLCEDCRSRA